MRPTDVTPPFSRRSARIVGAVAIVSLLAAFLLLILPGDALRVRSYEADSYSRSALGHRALVRLLREVDLDVRQRRSVAPGFQEGLLILAEPDPDTSAKDLQRLIDGAERTLIVLPKRTGSEDPLARGWIDRAGLRPLDDPSRILTRLADLDLWPHSSPLRRGPIDALAASADLPLPHFEGETQYLEATTSDIDPLITCRGGVLLARQDDLFVLSDSDPLANHGLVDNAEFAVAMLSLLSDGGPITFDETLHGHAREPSMWRALGSYPLVLVPVHLLLLFALTLWAAHGRYGPMQRDPRAIAVGKAFLIDNIAALLRTNRVLGPSFERYVAQRLRAAARRLNSPSGLNDEQCARWVIERAGHSDRTGALRTRLEAAMGATGGERVLLRTAHQLHRITEEIVDGTK